MRAACSIVTWIICAAGSSGGFLAALEAREHLDGQTLADEFVEPVKIGRRARWRVAKWRVGADWHQFLSESSRRSHTAGGHRELG